MTQNSHRRSRGEARREQIIDEALRAFADNGYRGASIAEIAERCGLSQPGLLHYFPSKTALLAAVLEQRDRIDYDRFSTSQPLRGKDALMRLVQLVEYNAHVPGLVRLFTVLTSEAATADHPAHAWAVERYRKLAENLARVLAEGQADGVFRADVDMVAVARQITAMMDGLQLQWLLDPERVDMPGIFRAYIEDLIARLS
ncbi:TetR/AcrR family transcriptional regulator [Nocardia inohanensis]|uniref:TetR/AcrR family transcriptional regulator n=1 Tax=Nocardia inohanensis TaxID=209246 RepID=UPI00082DB98B|nr:TetR/AcrR family transcriptional regulator [Nocardia inohanensis]